MLHMYILFFITLNYNEEESDIQEILFLKLGRHTLSEKKQKTLYSC